MERNPYSNQRMRTLADLAAALQYLNVDPKNVAQGGLPALVDASKYVEHLKVFEERIGSLKGLLSRGEEVPPEVVDPALEAYKQMLLINHEKAMEDATRILASQGGRRRRHTRRRKTKHRKSRRRRVGGKLPVFAQLEQQGPEIDRLVKSVKDHVRSDNAVGAVTDYRALIKLVGQPEAERLLKDLPPPELAKILQA